MTEYLAFIDEIGRTTDGKYIYRFDFTVDKDVVWGDYFNIVPAAIVPDLQPDINSLKTSGKVIMPKEMIIAKKNACFSMQDCIDEIIALGFFEIESDIKQDNGAPLFFMFGEDYEQVNNKIKAIGCNFYDIQENNNSNEEVIDNLIDSIEKSDDYE